MDYEILEVNQGDVLWDALLAVAPSMSESIARNLTLEIVWSLSDHYLVAVSNDLPVGVLRYVVQRLGEDEDQPPFVVHGKTLVEVRIVAFGVTPNCRRQGIGRALQQRAAKMAKAERCYQIRSRVRYKSIENFHMQLTMGRAIQPSLKNDSAYFIAVL